MNALLDVGSLRVARADGLLSADDPPHRKTMNNDKSNPVTPERLLAIEARGQAAKRGPWCWEAGRLISCEPAPYGDVFCVIQGVPGSKDFEAHCHAEDADFIADARQDVPDLCAEVRRSWEAEDAHRNEVLKLRSLLAQARPEVVPPGRSTCLEPPRFAKAPGMDLLKAGLKIIVALWVFALAITALLMALGVEPSGQAKAPPETPRAYPKPNAPRASAPPDRPLQPGDRFNVVPLFPVLLVPTLDAIPDPTQPLVEFGNGVSVRVVHVEDSVVLLELIDTAGEVFNQGWTEVAAVAPSRLQVRQ